MTTKLTNRFLKGWSHLVNGAVCPELFREELESLAEQAYSEGLSAGRKEALGEALSAIEEMAVSRREAARSASSVRRHD